jgi:hypothetical protein
VEFCRVEAEVERMKAAELSASAGAFMQMTEIIEEAGAANLATAIPILTDRAEQGDKQAADLLDKLNQAAIISDISKEDDD